MDIDEEALEAATAELCTHTIEQTINAALRSAARKRAERVAAALDVMASTEFRDRPAAWR